METHGIDDKKSRLNEVEKLLAQKTAVAERLIAERDAIIDGELRRHEESAFYIRLQSRCFNLYPLLVRILLAMIDDPQRRTIFRSVINGKDIHRVAARLAVTPEEIGTTFCTTVRSLSHRVGEMLELFAGCRKLRKQNEELRRKYLEAEAERERLRSGEKYLLNRMDELRRICRAKKEEVKLLREKLKQEREARRAVEREKNRLRDELCKKTHTPKGLLQNIRSFRFICQKNIYLCFHFFRKQERHTHCFLMKERK